VRFLAKYDGSLGSELEEPVRSTSLEAESQNIFSTTSIVEPQRSCTDTEDSEEESDDKQSISLHSAVKNRSIFVLKRLRDRGADANERNKHLQTPLYVASRTRTPKVARTSISYGADVNCRDTFGWTPLHTAAQYGRTELVRVLLDNGADVNAARDDSDDLGAAQTYYVWYSDMISLLHL
jgi:ankyrin repeat protein